MWMGYRQHIELCQCTFIKLITALWLHKKYLYSQEKHALSIYGLKCQDEYNLLSSDSEKSMHIWDRRAHTNNKATEVNLDKWMFFVLFYFSNLRFFVSF